MATTPSPRQVFDHYSSAVAWHGYIAWEEEPPFVELVPIHSEQEAFERAEAAAASADYQDVHCWVLTPTSFARLFGALQRLRLVPFSLDHCSETIGGEFFATLRAATTMEVAATPVDDGLPASTSEHAVLRSELRDTQLELRRTLSSRSWNVTRPLRALNRIRSRWR